MRNGMATDASQNNDQSINSELDDDKEWSDCEKEESVKGSKKKGRKKLVQLNLGSYRRPAKKRKARSNSSEQSFTELSDVHSELKGSQRKYETYDSKR